MKTLILNLRILMFAIVVAISLWAQQLAMTCLYIFVSRKAAMKFIDTNLNRHTEIAFSYLRAFFKARYELSIAKDITIEKNKSYLIISNHQSFIDIITIVNIYTQYVQNKIRFVVKKSLSKHIPYVSQLMRVEQYGFIDRNTGVKTISIIQDLSKRCKQNNASLVIFPEGTRSKDGNLKTFNSSAIRSALLNGPLSIIVVAVDGGTMFTKLFKISDLTLNYKTKFLKVFEDVNKQNAKQYIEEAQVLIQKQLDIWRNKNLA